MSKFAAWARKWTPNNFGIDLQTFGVEEHQERHCILFDNELQFDEAFARAAAVQYPRSLFFFGDEPDVAGFPAHEYASAYGRFVEAVKRGSATARVSPAGFVGNHNYHEEFFEANDAPVDEWRLHLFYGRGATYPIWEERVRELATWSVAHGASMVLGSFGSPAKRLLCEIPLYEEMRKSMAFIAGDSRIVQAIWWSFDWNGVDDTGHPDHSHYLLKPEGTLTNFGKIFVEIDAALGRDHQPGMRLPGNWMIPVLAMTMTET